jgi:hypothetical protein
MLGMIHYLSENDMSTPLTIFSGLVWFVSCFSNIIL